MVEVQLDRHKELEAELKRAQLGSMQGLVVRLGEDRWRELQLLVSIWVLAQPLQH